MIVHDFHVNGVGVNPSEAYPPLVIDTNAVLTEAVAAKRLQTVPRNCRQVWDLHSRVHLIQFPFRHRGNSLEPPAELAPEYPLCLPVPERTDHTTGYYHLAYNAMRWAPLLPLPAFSARF
jgi:hypothetical protein